MPFQLTTVRPGPIEPDFRDLAIVSQEFCELVNNNAVVGFSREAGGPGIAAWIVLIPQGVVDPEPQSLLAAGVGHFLHHVALPVPPG
jgi:hypothetical protein